MGGMPRRRHVTILIANLPAERDRRVIRQCLALEEHGYEVTVIAPRGQRGLRTLPGSRGTRLRPYPVFVYGSGVLSYSIEFVWSFLCIGARLAGEVLAGNIRMLQVAGDLAATATSRLLDGLVEVAVDTTATDRALAGIDTRDRTAERASLQPLLAPRSVAVVGAGRRPGGIGHEVLKALVGYGFTGPVYPVNPHATAVAGVPAYRSLAELPGPAELIVVAVPADRVARVLAAAPAALASGSGGGGRKKARATIGSR